ncbi:MAG: methionine--tRNA ligase, partial [Acidobacteria bacterium]|nr:methionine--tRNA ligase [Acidobacteriota bacterium]
GARIAEIAAANGVTPQEWCDRQAAAFREAWTRLDIAYDGFIRTTDARHTAGVQRLLERMHGATGPDGRPVIYEGVYEGLYCLGCEKFITEKELVDGQCPAHLTTPEKLTERNYFFRLSAFLPQLEAMIADDTIRIRPEERKHEVQGLFKQGLDDFSISREKVTWGIPLPFDPTQNAYVWVDALPNYITAIGYGDDPESFATWWTGAQTLHLMAKDILKFHAVYWPAMLMAVGEAVPDSLFIHGYFTVNGQKMSKSLGNAIDPHALVDRFGPDGARHLLLTQFQLGQDGDVKEAEFVRQFNADLANDLGNLVSRTVKMIQRHFGGSKPPRGDLDTADRELHATAERAISRFAAATDSISPNHGIAAGLDLVRAANRYFEHTQPWTLAKANETVRLGTVLATATEAIRVAAVILSPDIPAKSRSILRALGFTDPEAELTPEGLHGWDRCPGPFQLQESIFPRLDKKEKAGKEMAVTPSETPEAAVGDENVITIDQFRAIDLRTAAVVSAARVEGTDRLLQLEIDVGGERRQIVAGIAKHYAPDALVGKTIIVVANLQPTKIRGVTSHGMLLAASTGDTLRLLTTDGPLEPGTGVG